MPVRTEVPQNLLANENILDLRGLIEPDLTIIDRQGAEWKIAADLPLRTALVLLQHAQQWESGSLDAQSFNATVDGMHAILKRCRPDVTRDDVIDSYSVSEMISVISFLSLRLRARAAQPNGTEDTQEKRQETRRRKPLQSASVPET